MLSCGPSRWSSPMVCVCVCSHSIASYLPHKCVYFLGTRERMAPSYRKMCRHIVFCRRVGFCLPIDWVRIFNLSYIRLPIKRASSQPPQRGQARRSRTQTPTPWWQYLCKEKADVWCTNNPDQQLCTTLSFVFDTPGHGSKVCANHIK